MTLHTSSILAIISLFLAYVVDLIVGDPRFLPHPVVLMGRFISFLDRRLSKTRSGKWKERLKGCLFPLLLVGGVYFLVRDMLALVEEVSPWLRWALEIWLISTTIATKGLADAGRDVFLALKQGDVPLARQRLSYIVGRDTAHLDEKEITRGAIETVAENIVDAVTSPLFFAAIGGAPLALAYRAINTLDSMVGYKIEKYLHLGWASARLDDVANFIPARLTVPFLALAAWVLRFNSAKVWTIARRDAWVHPSPNSGFAEAAVAGALEIRLGGVNTYAGVESFRAYMGDAKREIVVGQIMQAVRLLYVATGSYLIGLLVVLWAVFDLFG
jgi:adenosylcobinamide-phosphate synthase